MRFSQYEAIVFNFQTHSLNHWGWNSVVPIAVSPAAPLGPANEDTRKRLWKQEEGGHIFCPFTTFGCFFWLPICYSFISAIFYSSRGNLFIAAVNSSSQGIFLFVFHNTSKTSLMTLPANRHQPADVPSTETCPLASAIPLWAERHQHLPTEPTP